MTQDVLAHAQLYYCSFSIIKRQRENMTLNQELFWGLTPHTFSLKFDTEFSSSCN